MWLDLNVITFASGLHSLQVLLQYYLNSKSVAADYNIFTHYSVSLPTTQKRLAFMIFYNISYNLSFFLVPVVVPKKNIIKREKIKLGGIVGIK